MNSSSTLARVAQSTFLRNMAAKTSSVLLSILLATLQTYGNVGGQQFIQQLQLASAGNLNSVFRSTIFTTRTYDECFNRCFLISQSEVCQLQQRRNQTITWENIQCLCSTRILAKYLVAFPNRYIVTNGNKSTRYEIFYRSDRLGSNTPYYPQANLPILFYTLDSISGGMNLGSLDASRYSLTMSNGTIPLYDYPRQ